MGRMFRMIFGTDVFIILFYAFVLRFLEKLFAFHYIATSSYSRS